MARKYPLETVDALRKRSVDQKVERVADRVRVTAGADDRARRARDTERAHDAVVAAARASERARLESGAARVADLLQEREWELGTAEVAARLAEESARATDAAKAARAAEDVARTELAAARGDARAVERHRGRWERARALQAERAEEEAAADARQGRKGPT